MAVPFSYAYYREMLRYALEKDCHIIPFSDFEADANYRQIILRHDVDLSLEAAERMAILEHAENIRSTYLLRLNSTFYNLFSEHDFLLVRNIMERGHEIGLHFDPEFYKKSGQKLVEGLRGEIKVLENIFQVSVKTISQHRPLAFGMANFDGAADLDKMFTHNQTYSEQCKYISDSGGNWREGDIVENVERYRNLQAHVHPVWWGEESHDWQTSIEIVGENRRKVIFEKLKVLTTRYGNYLKNRKDKEVN